MDSLRINERGVTGNRACAIPYGYYRKPDDKQTLYVDEEAAKVVSQSWSIARERG